jgi:hypothetical protein
LIETSNQAWLLHPRISKIGVKYRCVFSFASFDPSGEVVVIALLALVAALVVSPADEGGCDQDIASDRSKWRRS